METPIRVVIADDNADMRRIERMMISRAEGFEIVGEAEDGVQLLTLVEQEKPQLVFLDVEMPGKTGVECARVIQDMNPAIVLIFATAHDEYMGDAFEVYAFDYLLKPFKKERVMQTLERAKKRIRHQTDGSWLVSGSASVDDVAEELDVKDKDEEEIDAVAIGGLVQEKLSRLPKVGDHFVWGSFDGTVTRATNRRVQEVRLVSRPPEPETKKPDRRDRDKD